METNVNKSESAGSSKNDKDSELWRIAQKRASFKYHALIYFIVNIFLWTLWYINLRNDPTISTQKSVIPWPVWPMFGWGIGLFLNYLAVYKNRNTLAEKEYESLKKNNI